jgi:hypothetical protein
MSTDPAAVEHALARIGAAFRLSRLYPATHPALAEALGQIRTALAAARVALPVELRILPNGAQWARMQAAAGGGPLADLGALLFTHGARMMTIGPGTTAEHVLVLFAVATGSAALDDPGLGPIALSRAARRSTQRLAIPDGTETAPSGSLDLLRQRHTGGVVFRPDALPPEIAARRGIQAMRAARDAEAREAAAGPLPALVPDLVARRDAALAADAIIALDGARQAEPGHAGPALARAAAAFASADLVELLLERLGDSRTPAGERELLVRAVGLLADVAAGPVIEAYLAAPAEGREPYRAAIRGAGERAVAPLESYLRDARPAVTAVAAEFVALVAGARTADLLTPLVRHADAGVREAALVGLSQAGGRLLVRTAVPALRDENPSVRAAAAQAVAAAGDVSAVEVLIRRADAEEDEGVLAEVLRAIGRLGGPDALDALTRFAQPGALLRRRTPFVRSAAVSALGQLPGPEARALVEHYSHDREPAVRRAAQAAMTI